MNQFGRFSIFNDPENDIDSSKYCHRLEGELLKKFQASLLEIAKDIVDICEKESIAYFLGGGTALGAVRHGGFIPWDDDMDINMLSSDYPRFRESFLREYGGFYTIKDKDTMGFDSQIVRVIRKGSFIDRIDGADGFPVDIFLWRNVPDNALLRMLHGFSCMAVGAVFSSWCFAHDRTIYLQVTKNNPKARLHIYPKIVIGGIAHVLSLDTWRKIVWSVYGLCKNDRSKYITVQGGRKRYFKSIHPRDKLIPGTKRRFEGCSWNVARDYDSYLSVLYGPDYMTPPPSEKQEHHYYSQLVFPREGDKIIADHKKEV